LNVRDILIATFCQTRHESCCRVHFTDLSHAEGSHKPAAINAFVGSV